MRTSEFCNYQGVGACTIDLFKFKYCIYVTANPPLTLFLCIVSFACYIKCWLAVNSLFLLTCTDDLSNLSSVMRPDEHRLVISWLWNTHISTQTGTHRERERERCWLERGEVVRGTFGEFCNHPCDIWALLSPFLAPSSNFCILKHKTKTCIRLSMVNLGIKKHMLTLPSHHRISKQQIRTIKSIQQQLDLTLMSFYSVCGWGHLMLGVNSKALLSIVPSAPPLQHVGTQSVKQGMPG